jgi:tRNA(Ile2) C34 agmatinyltransferase TiaS
MRLIDADALEFNFQYGYDDRGILLVPFRDAKKAIEAAKTVDAAPVSHGKWMPMYRSGVKVERGYVSTCCDMWAERKSPYCPRCGARMDGRG